MHWQGKCKHLQSTVCESSWQDTRCDSQGNNQTARDGDRAEPHPLCPPCAPQHAGQTPVAPHGSTQLPACRGEDWECRQSATFDLQMNIFRLLGRRAELAVQFRTLLAAGQGLCSGFPPSLLSRGIFKAEAGMAELVEEQGWVCRTGRVPRARPEPAKPRGRRLQQRLALLRQAFPEGQPSLLPSRARWELLHQPQLQEMLWQCPPAQHSPGAARGGGIRVSQRSSGMLTAPAALFLRPGRWDMLRAPKPSWPCPAQLQEQREDWCWHPQEHEELRK